MVFALRGHEALLVWCVCEAQGRQEPPRLVPSPLWNATDASSPSQVIALPPLPPPLPHRALPLLPSPASVDAQVHEPAGAQVHGPAGVDASAHHGHAHEVVRALAVRTLAVRELRYVRATHSVVVLGVHTTAARGGPSPPQSAQAECAAPGAAVPTQVHSRAAWTCVALATGRAYPWLVSDGAPPPPALQSPPGPPPGPPPIPPLDVSACCISAGGMRIATGTARGAACIWNMADGSIYRVLCAAGPGVVSVALTSVTAAVCTARDDGQYTCSVYSLAGGGVTWTYATPHLLHHVYMAPTLTHHGYKADGSVDTPRSRT